MTKISKDACFPAATVAAQHAAQLAANKTIRLDIEGQHFHPLEVMTFFRRWPRSFLRNLIYTLIFNAMFAVGFTVIGVLMSRQPTLAQMVALFGNNLVISNVIGFAFWAVMELIAPLMKKINMQSFFTVALFYAVLGTAIVSVSFFILAQFPGYHKMMKWIFTPQQLITSFLISLVISLVIATIWRNRVNELAGQITLAEERTRAASAERAAVQANLRALQAQIEPHFLFNTLANVTSLIHTKPDEAKKMLEEFIGYLRASLDTSRKSETTFAKEFAFMQSYLSVLKVRMGNRLSIVVDLPDDVKQLHLPPMLIQPLVENAIKHGLEPKIDGGQIKLSARLHNDRIEVEVVDNGLGFQSTTSDGVGLKNVRERLEKIYGARASLVIQDNPPRGTRITISIPT